MTRIIRCSGPWRRLLIGAMGYGTYEFTNLATLKDWTWAMVARDFTWGSVPTDGGDGGVAITRA